MSHKSKVSAEEKVNLVQRYLAGEISRSEGGRSAGVDWNCFQDWINRYEAEGAQAFISTEHNRIYSESLKELAVTEYLRGGINQRDICKKYKIKSSRQLRDWIKVYNSGGAFKRIRGERRMSISRKTTQKERITIAKECLESGKKYGEIALKYQISYHRARAWALRYEKLGEAGLEDRRGKRKKDQVPRTELEKAQIEIEQLKHKLYLAEMERNLLKKVEELERRDALLRFGNYDSTER